MTALTLSDRRVFLDVKKEMSQSLVLVIKNLIYAGQVLLVCVIHLSKSLFLA